MTTPTARTSAVELALLRRALALVEVLVAHLRRHRDALSGGLGDELGHPERGGDVAQERHGGVVSSIYPRKRDRPGGDGPQQAL